VCEKSFFNLFLWKKKKMNVKGELIIMCEEVLFMEENVCNQKSMKGSCV
jgi:hypothetical protein